MTTVALAGSSGALAEVRTRLRDSPLDFVIVDDPAITSGFVWQERLWGNMRLKPLEML